MWHHENIDTVIDDKASECSQEGVAARGRARYINPVAIEEMLSLSLLGALSEQEQEHVPPSLFYSGDKNLLSSDIRRVAIVGSRKASAVGIRRAEDR